MALDVDEAAVALVVAAGSATGWDRGNAQVADLTAGKILASLAPLRPRAFHDRLSNGLLQAADELRGSLGHLITDSGSPSAVVGAVVITDGFLDAAIVGNMFLVVLHSDGAQHVLLPDVVANDVAPLPRSVLDESAAILETPRSVLCTEQPADAHFLEPTRIADGARIVVGNVRAIGMSALSEIPADWVHVAADQVVRDVQRREDAAWYPVAVLDL